MDALDKLRLLLADTKEPVLGDMVLQELLDDYRVPDQDGLYVDEAGYESSYDIYGAASTGWVMKAAKLATDYTIQIEGKLLSRQQMQKGCLEMARQMRKRQMPRSLSLASREILEPELPLA